MTRHERLALVLMGTDPRDTMGDEQAPAENAQGSDLAFQLRTSVEFVRLRKQIERLYECPEIAAMLERMDNRRLYT